MSRTVLVWALVLVAGAFALEWLEFQYLTRVFARDAYVAITAAAFAAGGLWIGLRVAARSQPAPFEPNTAAIRSLGLTGQEVRVLHGLAAGRSNKEIARDMGLSPNTVKSHLARLFTKLEVSRRTQAIGRARELHLIP